MKSPALSLEEKFQEVMGKFKTANSQVLYLETWDLPGDLNMDLDLKALNSKHSIFRLYTWEKPTLSLGRLQLGGEADRLKRRAEALGVPVVVRPTGGRAVLHYKELTYSFAGYRSDLNVLDIHLLFNYVFREAISKLNCDLELEQQYNVPKTPNCFELRAIFELGFSGQKVMGSAIRLERERFLIHGSLLLERDKLWDEIFGSSFGFVGLYEACPHLKPLGLEKLKEKIKETLSSLGIKLRDISLKDLEEIL